MKTRATDLLGIDHPIVQAGMSWASSCAALPAAVSNAGGLGVLAAGPMRVADFSQALDQLRRNTDRPYAVNLPLYRPEAAALLDVLYQERVPVIFASQGSPTKHLDRYHAIGTKWIHVVSTIEHARKAVAAGVDGLVVVGAEAGGHPPANQVGTLVIVRKIAREFDIPLIAGGGAADGYGIAALLALGADAVQLGTRFLMTEEAAVHPNYKHAAVQAGIDGTTLVGRKGLPVRMIHNDFARHMESVDAGIFDKENYAAEFGKSTLKQAALEGNVDWGKVEMGQSAGLIDEILPAAEVVRALVGELEQAWARLQAMHDRPEHDSLIGKRAPGGVGLPAQNSIQQR
jgi:enoyl-[acyl-carrier protein] reductase II